MAFPLQGCYPSPLALGRVASPSRHAGTLPTLGTGHRKPSESELAMNDKMPAALGSATDYMIVGRGGLGSGIRGWSGCQHAGERAGDPHQHETAQEIGSVPDCGRLPDQGGLLANGLQPFSNILPQSRYVLPCGQQPLAKSVGVFLRQDHLSVAAGRPTDENHQSFGVGADHRVPSASKIRKPSSGVRPGFPTMAPARRTTWRAPESPGGRHKAWSKGTFVEPLRPKVIHRWRLAIWDRG